MKNTFLKTFRLAALAISISSCSNETKKAEAPLTDPLAEHIDTTISAGENFFLYANNTWFKNHPIPESESSNGIFRTIQDTINAQIKDVCEKSAATNAEKGSNKQKIGDFYASGMDTATIDKLGISPLADDLKKIDDIKTTKDLLATTAYFHTIGASSMFGFYITKDDKNSSQYSAYLTQTSGGLPEREYYLDKNSEDIRKQYVTHLQTMFKLMGDDETNAVAKSKSIMDMETAMAKASRKMEDLRDPYKNYNKMSVAQVNKITPSINWNEMFATMGLNKVDSVVVGQPEYFSALETFIKKYSIEDWKTFLKWNLVNSYASHLSNNFEKADFNFYYTTMEGVKSQKPRWKRIVSLTDRNLGELIGQIYIEEYLPKGTKEKLLEIGNNIRDVYADHIKKLDWMSDVTKEKALSKLAKITMKVGYPDKWKDMSSVEIDKSSFCKNVMAVNKWQFNDMITKYGKPVDRTEWGMYPQTYNAYYDPGNNEICVPACNILVPGYEGRMPDDAILYGIIGGSTFGHEITHGFDDQGSQYDESGNLNEWWTKEDRAKFLAKTKLIIEQYNEFTVLDSIHVKGEVTQGENIADLGGVVMGYEAFKKTSQGKSKEKIAGLTPDQRYFLGYGYAWMVNRTNEGLKKQVMTDVHSPSEFRINGPVANMPEFYAAFGIKQGDKMWRADSLRVVIW